jgi:stage II sporulation protein D
MSKFRKALITKELHGVSRSYIQSKIRYLFESVAQCKLSAAPWFKELHTLRNARSLSIIWILSFLLCGFLSAQVKVRLFTGIDPGSVIFTVTRGEYKLDAFRGNIAAVKPGEPLIISKFDGKLAVKTRNSPGFIADSVLFSGMTGNDSFSLRANTLSPVRQNYSGDLQCKPDLGALLLINICDVEAYIAGVVNAEGGSGKIRDYFMTQAVIARTYMYRNLDKHINDGYNLCDNTHCQAFNGITDDTLINRASFSTRGLVILGSDSTLIISAFHANCGGETSPAENVWLTGQTYLKKVSDPYCLFSRNARWQKSFSISEWLGYLKNSGLTEVPENLSLLNFSQINRLNDYRAGSFSLPLRQIRTDFDLRSAYFSVKVEGDSVRLSGRGYGHGVGLCQEGAMVMASKGFDFKQIINFYYTGVIISDIKNAVRK